LQKEGYNIIEGNVEKLEVGGFYDIIIAGELLEHLTNHKGFSQSIESHLKPNGYLIMTMPNGNSVNYIFQTLIFKHELDAWDHTCFFTPTTLNTMLTKCGFRPTKFIVYQPTEIYHHEKWRTKYAAMASNIVQRGVCAIFPQCGRGLNCSCSEKLH
jgi:2-polyprenyl-3-methyl-5-hydroxy-6-metoxy-1,4-benzoquinol methylase